ncbi:MFS transporter [Alphaproteobacteria bacterium]|jgi:MFS family permease|nr:MFS transporter [Alphaproteobacteria bacterium]
MIGVPQFVAARTPFYYGWVILACICCVSFARQGAAVATLSIFIGPMTDELGWSRTAISGAVSLSGILAAVSSPMLGPVVDRHGARTLLMWAVMAMAIGCLLLATVESLPLFYLYFCLARTSFAGPFDLGIYGALNNWFVRLRPIATSISTLWFMVGLTAMPLIGHFAMGAGGDWRWGWVAIAATVVIMGFVPTALLLLRRPEDIGLKPDGGVAAKAGAAASSSEVEPNFSRAQALRTRAFWALLAFTFLAYPVQAGVSLHQAPHLIELGLSPTIAATVVSTFSAVSGVVGFLVGPIVRPIGVRWMLCMVAGFLAAAAFFMNQIETPVMAYFAAALFGVGIGGLLTVPMIAWADAFGRRSFGAIRGLALSVQVSGQAIGPVLSGILWDQTGNYQLSLVVFTGFAIAAGVAALGFVKPQQPAPTLTT